MSGSSNKRAARDAGRTRFLEIGRDLPGPREHERSAS